MSLEKQLEILVDKALTPISELWPEANASSVLGPRKVGSFLPNEFGLFDLYGNVWEWCLDRYDFIADSKPIDPVGTVEFWWDRVVRGGSFASEIGCRSNCREWKYLAGQRSFDTGFRLCLQGGDIPDLSSTSTLVNESGAGSQSWTPTRSGAYYLTHATMNGTTNVQLASAWFEVPGCTLTLEQQGELTNGVNVAVGGAGEGWTVYYTTDGSAPTTNTTAYVGAFSLPQSGTVRAIAYNAQGVASEEATTTFTLHDALSVVGAVARPRYPWNGMVDVDVELKGDPERQYLVELEALDVLGKTNRPVRTVGARVPACPHANADANGLCWECGHAGRVTLPPGRHRLTWNADADIDADGDFSRVAVTVKATAQSVVTAYNRSLSIAVDGYAGSETLTNVPVLVRLSTNIAGFAYSDFASPTNGADLAFFDANENELPYEIDEWHTNGESLVWVKLPTLAEGTKFTCAYGHVDAFVSNASDKDGSSSSDAIGTIASTERARMKHEVWREYAGVWHMNEDSGTAYDSTEHRLDALPSCGADMRADISQMVAYENGACGRARVNSPVDCGEGTYLLVPSYDALGIADTFSMQGWFWLKEVRGCPRLFSRKNAYSERSGWEVFFKESAVSNGVMGANNSVDIPDHYVSMPTAEGSWVSLLFQYAATNVYCYANGILRGTQMISPATNNGNPLAFGNTPVCSENSLNGQYDEIRLRGGSLSADRIKADYDMIANPTFCTYGTVKKGAE